MKALLLILAFVVVHPCFGQGMLEYAVTGTPDSEQFAVRKDSSDGCELTRTVFGWHPYWMNGFETNYKWNLLSDLCYFSYEVDPATGTARTTNGFEVSNAVTIALAKGKRVHLCVTLFDQHALFLESPFARETLINNLVDLLKRRKAHGINIDFEKVPPAQSANFTDFMVELGKELHSANPDYQLSICLPSVDWSNSIDELTLNTVVDLYTVMGYDYHYAGSPQAGPVDPLYGYSKHFDYSISKSINYYLHAGIPADKLILGIPYYGREWETANGTPTQGTIGKSRTYSYIRNNSSGNYVAPVADKKSQSSFYRFQEDGKWKQCWLTQADQLKERYDFVLRRNLKGIGLWTLGADNGYSELWDAISDKLSTCRKWNQSDTLYDDGGPESNYYNNESFDYTIAPEGAGALEVSFLSFNTEKEYDKLSLYDGPSTSSPLIGTFSGKNNPGKFTTTTGFLTVQFISDSRSNGSGWEMTYAAVEAVVPVIAAVPKKGRTNWATNDFTATFAEANTTESYWNVQSLLQNEWKSNPATEHVYDEFNIRGLWNTSSGDWVVDNGRFHQTDNWNTNANASLHFPLQRSESYLFQWKGRIGGEGENRRAGLQIMCETPELPNRGNSYYVSFRVDEDMIQLYRTTNDFFSLVTSIPFTLEPNTTYDSKTTYNKSTGLIEIYIDDLFIGSWTDPHPIKSGKGISLRSSNAIYSVDLVAVYPSCRNKELIRVGSRGHLLTCNPSPTTPAGRIISLALNHSKKSRLTTSFIDVDFSVPEVETPREGLTDIDTLVNNTQLMLVNLLASDPNSALANFNVRIESLTGSVILADKPVTQSTLFETLSGLVSGENYRIRVYACNEAGLCSDTISSDGFLYLNTSQEASPLATSIRVISTTAPSNNNISIEVQEEGELIVYSSSGERVIRKLVPSGISDVDCASLESGMYHFSFGNQLFRFTKD